MSKLTVYIPTYNRAKYLKKCIESVLIQSLNDYKIVVLDNASTDNTKDVVNSFSDERIEYYCHRHNIGGIGNLNYALEHAKGKYIVIFHDDDVMKENYLKTMYSFMEEHEKCSLVSCMNDEIDKEGIIICENKKKNNDILFESGKIIEKYIYEQYNLVFPTIMYRVESIKKYNIHMNKEVGPCADVIMYLDAEKQGACIGVVNEALIKSRIHASQDSSENFGNMLIDLIKYMSNNGYYRDYLDKNQRGQKRYYNWFAKNIIIKVASKSIDYRTGKSNIREMGKLLKNDMVYRVLFSAILFTERVFPNLYYRAYLAIKKIKKRG